MSDGAIQGTAMFLMRPWIGSCASAMERLSSHLEHALPAREERRVRRHLVRCRRCREMYESLLRTVEHVRALGRQDLDRPTRSVADLVMERVRHDRE
jgi:predicted anti-sigma-YlaC factor YlaD